MLTSNQQTFLADNLPFYEQLTSSQKTYLFEQTKYLEYDQTRQIYDGYSECLGMVLIQNGMLRTYLLSPAGREVTLYRLWPQDVCILSASCVLKNINFDVQIDAMEGTGLYILPSDSFASLMNQNKAVEEFSYRLTNDRFSNVMWTVEQILFMSLDQRVAAFLIDESANRHCDTLTLTHAEIASYIGSAREAVSRMLKYFQEEGILTLVRGGLTITDKKRLYELIQNQS